MKGWFTTFRTDGGPTLYNFNNRTAVTGDVAIITILTIFTALYIAFLIIFPGIRKERFTTFSTVTLSIFVGATILVALFGSSWHISETEIFSLYKAFSNEKISANLGVYIGLAHFNVTLQARPMNKSLDIDFNERFVWAENNMHDGFREAIMRGMPFPILTVVEYLILGDDAFSWGSRYRSAGYYAIIMLWTSFALWILMNLLLIVVPRYGALLMTACGFMLLTTCCGYFNLIPEIPLIIHIEGKPMQFCFGWCFWLVVVAGGICLLLGVIVTAIEILLPHSFSTILEVDYDTPYDRHVIIEDSHGKRFQRKSNNATELKDTGLDALGLKRISSNTRKGQLDSRGQSIQNQFYEMEFTRFPRNYTIDTISGRPIEPKRLRRSISQETFSSISAESHRHSEL